MSDQRGIAGRLAASFIDSKLTPLVIAASILIGIGAVALLPREEEPQIVVPMIDVFVEMPGASPKEIEKSLTETVHLPTKSPAVVALAAQAVGDAKTPREKVDRLVHFVFHYLKADMVRPGAVVVDVGMNRLPDGALAGDVDFAGVKEVASAITPVPGGVGPMTITMLLVNTLAAASAAE